jgi:hypothetical protein
MRRSSIMVVVAAASAALAIPCAGGAQTPPAASPRALYPDAAPVRECAGLTSVSLPDTTVESAVDDQGVCRVTAVVTHPPADDKAKIWVALPIRNWNGRFSGRRRWRVVRKILDGPKRRDGSFLWYGTPRGALFLLSATGGTPLTAQPFAITLDWFRYFLTQNPK